MVRFSVAAALTFALSVYAFDPAGAKNVGNGNGQQFIGGQCLSSKDCASTCCAFIAGGGQCSGIGAQFQAGKQGCGFGDGGAPPQPSAAAGSGSSSGSSGSSSNAGSATGAIPIPAGFATGDASGPQNFGNAQGKQFITGICASNADCASGCCAGLGAGKGAQCSGPDVGNVSPKTGCGFTLSGGSAPAPAPAATPAASSGSTSNAATGAIPIPAGFATGDASAPQNFGNAQGKQFITGICASNADCASGCCAGLGAGKGAQCSGPDVGNVSPKTGCGFTLNKRSFEYSRIARRFKA
ncbi:hypothetical protein GGI43DRAFT_379993 [Trichoderma evansii]